MPIVLSAASARALETMHPSAFAGPVAEAAVPGRDWTEFRPHLAALAARSDPWENPPAPTAEERIYLGFTDWAEKDAMSRFRRAESWFERAGMVHAFRDERVREFAARAVVEHGGLTPSEMTDAAGETLAEEIAELAGAALERPFAPDEARWMTIAKARIEGQADDRFCTWLDDVATPSIATPPPAFEIEADRKGQWGWSF